MLRYQTSIIDRLMAIFTGNRYYDSRIIVFCGESIRMLAGNNYCAAAMSRGYIRSRAVQSKPLETGGSYSFLIGVRLRE